MIELPVGAILLFMGTVAPSGFKVVPCPWENPKFVYRPTYVDSMPRISMGPYLEASQNPDYYEYRCISRQPQ